MKVKIDLEKGESIEDAEEFLEKALKAKRREQFKPEKYADQAFEDFVEDVNKRHKTLLEQVLNEIKEEIKSNVGI